ncbi:MBL fold metallo-hydrolase [Sulfurimonas sp.]
MIQEEYMADKKNEQNIKVLGAFGTKAKGFGTISFMLNASTVVDAGNLLDTLAQKSVAINSIWLTHSHLDHIVDIAYILDNYFTKREETLIVYGLPATIKAIKENFLNDTIWPDFSKIKLYGSHKMAVEYKEVEIAKVYEIAQGEYIEAFETDHTVDCCGYLYTKHNKTIMMCADTYSLENIQKILESRKDIKSLIVECSFSNSMEKLAKDSKHLNAKLLFSQLNKIKRDDIHLYINHIKPTYIEQITEEIEENKGSWKPKILKDEDFIYF